jgi:alcohol dehydrogenase (cytochrome c)
VISHPWRRASPFLRRCGQLAFALLVSTGLFVAPSAASTAAVAAAPAATGSWPYPNADLANTRDAPDSTISSANVSSLRLAWTFRLTGKVTGIAGVGSLAVTPIVQNGVVYFQDLAANVYALSLVTGKLEWEYRVDSPLSKSLGPDGVAVTDGEVFGDSPHTAFALSAATGKPVWVDRRLLDSKEGTFGIQPQVASGRVYLASAVGAPPNGGVLLALNASDGALLWKFKTLSRSHPGVYAAGGAWDTPLVGTDGSVTYGIGNPYQSVASAFAHPTNLLYTDSDVNLNAATGKLRWYYQGVPDDFSDLDMQDSPIATTVNGVAAVVGSGKLGYVYAVNAATGALLWKAPVGEHNGHDNDSLRAVEHKGQPKVPFTYLPGSLGGVLTNLSLANGSLYVATVDYPFRITSLAQIPGVNAGPAKGSHATGEIEALNMATGAVEWDTKVPSMPLGATTVSNDLVFTTLFNGTLIAMNAATGATVYHQTLPTSANSSIAIAGNTVLVPAGGPTAAARHGHPQIDAYTAS